MDWLKERKRMLPGLVFLCAFGICLYFLMKHFEPLLLAQQHGLTDFGTLVSRGATEPLYRFLWFIGDWTEAPAYKSLVSSLLFLASAFAAHWICRKYPNVRMVPVSTADGVFPWVFFSSCVGLAISVAVFGSQMANGWIPTFLACCSLPAALVLRYGGGWAVSLTAGVLTGLIQYPFSRVAQRVAASIGVPGLTCYTVFSIFLAGIVIVEIFRLLPFTRPYALEKKEPKFKPYNMTNVPAPEPTSGWLIRRAIIDFTELPFFPNEIVSICMILGVLIGWVLNPAHSVYGIPNLLPAMLGAQFLAGGLSVFLYFGKYKNAGFYPTFGANVSVTVILLLLAATGVAQATAFPVVVATAVLSSLIVPPACALGVSLILKQKRYPVVMGIAPALGSSIGLVCYILKGLLFIGIL